MDCFVAALLTNANSTYAKRKFDVVKRKFGVANDDGLLTLRTQFQGSPLLRAQRSNP
jgi:hypothetical protein